MVTFVMLILILFIMDLIQMEGARDQDVSVIEIYKAPSADKENIVLKSTSSEDDNEVDFNSKHSYQ